MKKWTQFLLAVLALTGCSTGHDPEPLHPESAADQSKPQTQPELVAALEKLPTEEQWWLALNDTTLTRFEQQALSANHDLSRAMARVEEAHATARLAGVDRKPSISASGSAARSRSSETVQRLPANPNASRFRATVDVSYEVDLWDRVKHTTAAARADARQVEADLAAVRLALTSEVGNAYFLMTGSMDEWQVLRKTKAVRLEYSAVLKSRVDAGLANALDLTRAEAELSSLDAEMENLQRQHDLANHALAVLLGQRPNLISYASFKSVGEPTLNLPAGLPADLVKRRPDLVAAELAWQSAAERIGVAKAAFYPSFRLTASGGQESADLRDFLDFQSRIFSLGAGLTAPLFDGGKNQATLDAARSRAKQAAENFDQKLLNAYREFADAATNYQGFAKQATAVESTWNTAQSVVKLSRERYEKGLINYFEVIDGERAVLSSERTLSQLSTQRKLAMIAVIRAIGGGWTGLQEDAEVDSKTNNP